MEEDEINTFNSDNGFTHPGSHSSNDLDKIHTIQTLYTMFYNNKKYIQMSRLWMANVL